MAANFENRHLFLTSRFYSIVKFLWVYNFQPFAKMFLKKFLTCGVQCARAANSWNYFNKIAICKNLDPRKFSAIRYVSYTHYFSEMICHSFSHDSVMDYLRFVPNIQSLCKVGRLPAWSCTLLEWKARSTHFETWHISNGGVCSKQHKLGHPTCACFECSVSTIYLNVYDMYSTNGTISRW